VMDPVLIEQSDRGVQIFLPTTVLFESDSANFRAGEVQPYLRRVADLILNKTRNKVSIEGHADREGTPQRNQVLSEARAAAVRKALVDLGVEPSRLSSVGYSFNRPVASNATEGGRALNRRVELMILEEKLANITQGEPANAFASAWDQLKAQIASGAVRPVDGKP
ncbi:MAG: OmpA family protein, partial [Comamonadaceae bacterium]